MPTLIYCAAGNRRFAEIALRYGFRYGAQLPNTVYFDPYFVDQDWKRPNRDRYMTCLAQCKPALASVLDWERPEQLPEVLSWAEEAAQYVSGSVIIIPKVPGGVKLLPRQIGGKPVRLGYSASSSFSSTPCGLGEFADWPVHCLGGTVVTQRWAARIADVQSADGNYTARMSRMCMAYVPGYRAKTHSWPRLSEFGVYQKKDAIYTAFELTCMAVQMSWAGESSPAIQDAQIVWLKSQGYLPNKQLAFL